MKIAHIVPPAALSSVEDELSDYALLLPSLARVPYYRHFYRDRDGIKIMDNGIAEGRRIDFTHQLYSAKGLSCAEVVLPDVIGSMDGTLQAVAEVFPVAFEERKNFKYMLVAQGSTVVECFSTVERAMNMYPGIINCVGIPRHILDPGHGSRLKVIAAIRNTMPHMPIHLLGTHPEHAREILNYRGSYRAFDIRGVDTSLAWNATNAGIYLDDVRDSERNIPRQPIDEFKKAIPTDSQIRLLRENIEVMNSWVK